MPAKRKSKPAKRRMRYVQPQHVGARFAENLRNRRIMSDLTQARLAQDAGVTVETVARLERSIGSGASSANMNPTLETISRLASAMGVEAWQLLM